LGVFFHFWGRLSLGWLSRFLELEEEDAAAGAHGGGAAAALDTEQVEGGGELGWVVAGEVGKALEGGGFDDGAGVIEVGVEDGGGTMAVGGG